MNIEPLISQASAKVSGRLPRGVKLSEVVSAAREEIADMVVEKLQTAMESAILGAQSILRTTSQEYIEALYVTDNLAVGIRESARHLEYGYAGFEMLEGLLASPKAKRSKDGDRYIVVPIGDKPDADIKGAIQKKASELLKDANQVKASKRTLDQLVGDMQSVLRRSENAKVAPRHAGTPETRTASDKQDPAEDWVHPGFQGVNQLEFINQQLQADLRDGAVRILESVALRFR